MTDDTAPGREPADHNPGLLVAAGGETCLRLARRWYVLRYQSAGPASWDAPRPGAWTLRQIAEHVADVRVYAELVGTLS